MSSKEPKNDLIKDKSEQTPVLDNNKDNKSDTDKKVKTPINNEKTNEIKDTPKAEPKDNKENKVTKTENKTETSPKSDIKEAQKTQKQDKEPPQENKVSTTDKAKTDKDTEKATETTVDKSAEKDTKQIADKGVEKDIEKTVVKEDAKEKTVVKEDAKEKSKDKDKDQDKSKDKEKSPQKQSFKDKIIQFIKKYKLPLIIALAVIVVAAAVTTTVLVVNAPKVFVKSAEDFLQDTSKKKIYILRKDITVDGDLVLNDDLDINLNKKTLKVNGTLRLALDDNKSSTVNIGTLKKKEFINQGKLIANNIDISASNITLNMFSPLQASGEIKVKNLFLNEKVEIADNAFMEFTSTNVTVKTTISGSIKLFTSNLELSSDNSIDHITLDEYSNATIYGNIIDAIIGGNEISILGTANCPQVKNAKELYYQSQTATIDDAYNIGQLYIVNQLETPSQINIEKEGNSFYCIASQVLNADLYIFTIKEKDTIIKEIESDTNKIDITAYIKEPKTYTISAQASSAKKRINLPSGKKEIEYKYSIKLDSPTLSINETNENKIVLSFPTVNFATIYLIEINGNQKKQAEALDQEEMNIDLTSDLADIGSYYIKVIASNPSNSAFSDSDSIMISYLKTVKLGTPTLTLNDNGNNITLSWQEIENASSYIISNDKNDTVIMSTHNNHVFSKEDIVDGTVFSVYAQGKHYYISSDKASKAFVYPQLSTPLAPQYEIENNTLTVTVNKVDNATNYILYVNGEEVAESTTPHFSITDFEDGDKIKVEVEAKYYRSATSQEVTIVTI